MSTHMKATCEESGSLNHLTTDTFYPQDYVKGKKESAH